MDLPSEDSFQELLFSAVWIRVIRPEVRIPYLLSHHTSLGFIDFCSLLPAFFPLGVSVICSQFLFCRVDAWVVDLRLCSFPVETLFKAIKPPRKHRFHCLSHRLMLLGFSVVRDHSKFLLGISTLMQWWLRKSSPDIWGSLLGFHSSWKAHSIISTERKLIWRK